MSVVTIIGDGQLARMTQTAAIELGLSLRLLAGADAPHSGTLSLSPADAFVGWLPQEHERRRGETVAGYIARRTGCARATAEMDTAAAALEHPAPRGGPDPADVYAAALERWLASSRPLSAAARIRYRCSKRQPNHASP